MNKDNVAEKWSEQIDLCLQSENPREQIDRYIKALLTSHRLSLKEELMKKLPREWVIQKHLSCDARAEGFNEALSQVKDIITSVLKEE